MSTPTLPDICAQTALEAGRSGEKEGKETECISQCSTFVRKEKECKEKVQFESVPHLDFHERA